MLRNLLLSLPALFLFVFIPSNVSAQIQQFDIAVDQNYLIDEKGVTEVTQVIKITNKTEFYYTPTYTVSVGFDDITDIQAFNQDGSIPTTLTEGEDENKSIKLTFPKRYAGLSDSNTFTLKFLTKDIARKQGNIWEVTIPGIDKIDDFSRYDSTIEVPESFGKPSIIKPSVNISDGNKIRVSKNVLNKSGIYILYGDKQYYSFNLKYNISNPNLFPVKTEIALPSQTNYQNVAINSFSEEPLNVSIDPDGNWIAEYRLLPQQKKSIAVKGVIEVLSNPQKIKLTDIQVKNYTASKKYWDSNNMLIKEQVKPLKTAEDIYNFVQKRLTYNYEKIATDNLRLGGSGALTDSKNSVCLEFTDLFIALARAKGIPARSVEGFAYTQNEKLRPLSLANDILHAWPEYYDKTSEKWIMVDPTWGNTTKEMDYFNSLDFSHVAFTVKGMDSEYPIPAGGYKFNKESKDVKVEFAKPQDFKNIQNILVTENFPNISFPKVNLTGTSIIRNIGTVPMNNLKVKVTSSKGTEKIYSIDNLPPFAEKEITTTFKDIPFLTKDAYVITIQVGDFTTRKQVKISFLPDLQILILIGGLIGVSTIIAAITFHTGSIYFQRRKRKNPLRR